MCQALGEPRGGLVAKEDTDLARREPTGQWGSSNSQRSRTSEADDDETLRVPGRVRAAWTAHRVSRPGPGSRLCTRTSSRARGGWLHQILACQASPSLSDLLCPRGLTQWTPRPELSYSCGFRLAWAGGGMGRGERSVLLQRWPRAPAPAPVGLLYPAGSHQLQRSCGPRVVRASHRGHSWLCHRG